MSEELFPSGPWLGFYNYRVTRPHRHLMDLSLSFASGAITGEGIDDIGRFIIKGRYDAANRECYWTKTYIGAHDVFYRGFREGKGIWGTWETGPHWHGGFHIWPRQEGELEETAASMGTEAPTEPLVEAVGVEIEASGSRRRKEADTLPFRAEDPSPYVGGYPSSLSISVHPWFSVPFTGAKSNRRSDNYHRPF